MGVAHPRAFLWIKTVRQSQERHFSQRGWSCFLSNWLTERMPAAAVRRDAQGKSIIREQLGPIKPDQAVDNMWNIN